MGEVMRDPRIDPRVGDVLKRGKETRSVQSETRRADGQLWRVMTLNLNPTFREPWMGVPNISQWRRWAAMAEIMAYGDTSDAPKGGK